MLQGHHLEAVLGAELAAWVQVYFTHRFTRKPDTGSSDTFVEWPLHVGGCALVTMGEADAAFAPMMPTTQHTIHTRKYTKV